MGKDRKDIVAVENPPEIVEIQIENNSDSDIPTDQPKQKRQYKKRDKKDSSAKSKVDDSTVNNISSLIMAGFTIASMRCGEHWNIDSKEANSIAIPLSKILDKYNLLDKAENISDPLALIIATGTIVFPRVLISLNTPKQPKAIKALKESGGLKDAGNSNGSITKENEKRSNDGNSNINDSIADGTNTSAGEFIKAIC